jgi:hypothetical protein
MELLTVKETAGILRLSEDFVLQRFANLSGVVDLGSPEVVGRNKAERRRRHRILRIPRATLDKFIRERMIGA